MRRTRKKKAGTSWPIACRWVAMGTFVVYTAVGTKTVTLAYGQETRGLPSSVAALRRYDIPPGLLDAALAAFQSACRLQVRTANDAIGSLLSPGVSGVFPVSRRCVACSPTPARAFALR